jgi:hypothetical protein
VVVLALAVVLIRVEPQAMLSEAMTYYINKGMLLLLCAWSSSMSSSSFSGQPWWRGE